MKLKEYKVGKKVSVNDRMQSNYTYTLAESLGESAKDFHRWDFYPQLNPQQILKHGVFEGKYLNDCQKELPEEWFLSSQEKRSEKADVSLNCFKIKSRLSLNYWKEKKWIIGDDPRGWFQWYCRYYLGRRTSYDEKQISRWKSFKRHGGQIKANCKKGDFACRPKQRQALLQWAYDPFV